MSSGDCRAPVRVPTREELNAHVLTRPASEKVATPGSVDARKLDPPGFEGTRLSRDAERFLREAAFRGHDASGLEMLWRAVGVTSGSTKKRVLSELRGAGFVRLEDKGGAKAVFIYREGWDYLGMKPPKGKGRGGTTHRYWVDRLAGLFKRKGYDVRVEHEIGPARKRVDLVALGKQRIGVEVAASSPDQEIVNLVEDLRSGVLDLVLVASPDPAMLRRVRSRALKDPYLSARMRQIRLYQLKEDPKK